MLNLDCPAGLNDGGLQVSDSNKCLSEVSWRARVEGIIISSCLYRLMLMTSGQVVVHMVDQAPVHQLYITSTTKASSWTL